MLLLSERAPRACVTVLLVARIRAPPTENVPTKKKFHAWNDFATDPFLPTNLRRGTGRGGVAAG
jgi:hypothetical protein